MEAAGVTISCETASTKAGKSFFANEVEGEVKAVSFSEPEFSNCTTTGNGTPCKVKEPIEVEPVRAELALSDESEKPGKKILFEFDPVKGEEFVELKFEGAGCKLANGSVKRLVLGSVFTDPLAPAAPATATQVEQETNAKEYSSFLTKFPDKEASVYLWKEDKPTLLNVTEIELFKKSATLTGTVLILLANNGKSTGAKFAAEA